MSASPDIAAAVDRLRDAGILDAERATLFGRVARRDLVTVRPEVRAALYVGVLLLVGGAGLFLSTHLERLGPVAIGGPVGLVALVCLGWAWRRSAPFTWEEAASTHAAFDYVLLLGALLAAADLGYVESQTGLLGPAWPWHLLVVAVFYGFLAFRFDSKMLLSLALTTFAAWRGLAVRIAHASLGTGDASRLRTEALATGLAFAAIGLATARRDLKAHFEDVWLNAGAFLFLAGLLSGVFERSDWGLWLLALLAATGAVAVFAYRTNRTLPFAQAVFAAYLGLLRAVFAGGGEIASRFLFAALLGCAALAVVVVAHRRMKSE